MGFKCGIVGLPNVGKSTLFNALTQTAAAQAANYPFCTIEPNVGEVAVPDPRLDELAKVAGSKQIIPTRLTFVDIAGLVRGASKGEGLGNQFLANIRECDAIAHVVRCFEDGDVTHVEGGVDPLRDIETIETELMLADLDSLEKRVVARGEKGQGRRQGRQGAARSDAPLPRSAARGQAGAARRDQARGARRAGRSRPAVLQARALRLQCRRGRGGRGQCAVAKGFRARRRRRRGLRRRFGEDRERNRRAAGRGAKGLSGGGGATRSPASTGLSAPATTCCGSSPILRSAPRRRAPGRSRQGTRAPQAAGVIHTDFEKGFIRAETIAYADYTGLKGEAGAREAGKLRLEGKDYLVADGDVLHFRFNN